jgi:plastocyanin
LKRKNNYLIAKGLCNLLRILLSPPLRVVLAAISPFSSPRSSLFSYSSFLAVLLAISPSVRADVTGSVTLHGTPQSKDESFYAAAAACGGSPIRHTENWKISPQGGLQDVAIWIDNPRLAVPLRSSPAPAAPPAMRQSQCRYDPHVLIETAGVPFPVINLDATLHNIRAKVYDGPGQPPGADVFNFGQSYQGQTDQQQFDTPGIYTLQCDVHPWMQAWVKVLPHRDDGRQFFAVTDKDGRFSIPDGAQLADGDYQIEAWHPRFAQPLVQTLHVKNGAATVTFQFEGANSF